MLKVSIYKLFFSAVFCAAFSFSQAQVHNPNDENLYMDVTEWMKTLEKKSGELLKNSTYLDTTQAKLQLTAAEGKIAKVKKLNPLNKSLTQAELATLVKESTVVFGMAYDCGRCHLTHVNPASGYVIDEDGIIVTNHHVVESFTKSEGRKNLAMPIQTSNGNVYLVTEILASNEAADLCIVRVDTKGDKLKALPLGNAAKQGDEIFVMGHPNQMLYYFTGGNVVRNYMSPKSRFQTFSVAEMDITADYAAGSSGGPVVDNKGNLVATVSSTRSIYYNQQEQKNLQMVVKNTKPVISLKKMISWK
ncbi:S1 family peptidase [Sphingobacterium bovistauri]|uniref:Trypsin-like peptidase domain-containing protein n=1 Tax=Sphingobacterium bovistauri TaxID=2781959 RepID=A0ABS7ZD19_9SPHI|nr:serine protease [Sphingobacterium bovistauri]MCA5006629.1 trypsin-like peptidase domain-containing protein [Sphingobacterium bovistauri]